MTETLFHYGKPSWDYAPEQARHLAQGKNGVWFWHDIKPDPGEEFWVPARGARFTMPASYGPVIGDWRDTLESRPEPEDTPEQVDSLKPRPDGGQAAMDVQVGGDHYKNLAIQPIEYIHANNIGFCEGSVIKYVTRWRNKNGISDLEKARHFLDLLIEQEQLREGKNHG